MSTNNTSPAKPPSSIFLAVVHLKLIAIMVVGPMVIPNMAQQFSLSTIEVKGWTTAMLLGTGLVAFGAGAVSEALGRRLVGVLASIVLVLAASLSGLAESYWVILAMAPILGAFVSILDINMDGYVGSISKGRVASSMFSHVQMYSDLMLTIVAFVFGVLAVSTPGVWRWFFLSLALLNVATGLLAAREYPGGTSNREAIGAFLRHFKEGLKLLRMPAFLCVVGAATFGSATVAAIITDGPTALRLQAGASGWIYGGTFGLLALMGGLGYLVGMAISRRKSPATQLVVGSAAMAVTGLWMILAVVFAPGNSIALGLPMAISFGGHTIVTGAALASAVDIARIESSVGASMLTLFKRLVPLLLSVLLVALTAAEINNGPMTMSIAVFACAVLGLFCSILCVRLKADPFEGTEAPLG